ncbi:MAG: ubiquinol-cytochrome c reductase iron-sulfur subunit [Gemmataceae bacterium]
MAEPNNTSPATNVSASPQPAPKAAPAKKPVAKKPAAKGKNKEERRNFLLSLVATPFALAWTAFTLSSAILTLGTVRFLFKNVSSDPPSTFRAGRPDDYSVGEVSIQFKDKGAWVIKDKNENGQTIIYALSTVCTHLGCTPSWKEGDKKFKCPCHGSGFDRQGVNFEGPAPRPLERFAVSRTDDGQIIVDKSRKFQQELGQWSDPSSYIMT